MTSTIKVNTIQNACGADIIKESSNTITIGASGDTVTLASGASQTGFGRTGTVNWQTSIKTSNFTAANGEGYFCDTTSGGFTLTLPSSPSVGNIVSFKYYARTFNTSPLIVDRNGSNMDGVAANTTFSTVGTSGTLIYMDATKGWSLINDDATSVLGATYISASGGTETTCGNFKIHTFTSPGTFTVSSVGNAQGSNTVSYMVVAGGGGGGSANGGGGGGGAGGYRESRAASDSYTASPLNATSGPTYNLPVSVQGYPIVVGGGGGGAAGAPGCVDGSPGNTSSFSTISSAGGGGGSGVLPATADAGGSGGGAGGPGPGVTQAGGVGNTPPVSPAQGNPGGTAGSPAGSNNQGAGGGGAGGAGENATPEGPGGAGSTAASIGGNGGLGVTSCISGSPVGRAGGGGGNNERFPSVGAGKGGFGPQPGPNRNTTPGAGAIGDFGAGNGSLGSVISDNNSNATDNLGGGGGGVDSPQTGNAGNGGSGIVIIRYKFQ